MSEKHVGNVSATKWTAEHDAMLRDLRGKGVSSAQIGVHLNCEFSMEYTRNAVIGRCHRLGLTDNRKPTGPPKARVRTTPFREPMPANRPPELRCIEAKPLNILLLDLEKHSCRYPVNDGPEYLFCGQRRLKGFSYCWPHYALTHKPDHHKGAAA